MLEQLWGQSQAGSEVDTLSFMRQYNLQKLYKKRLRFPNNIVRMKMLNKCPNFFIYRWTDIDGKPTSTATTELFQGAAAAVCSAYNYIFCR
jgi:hypothetical protein